MMAFARQTSRLFRPASKRRSSVKHARRVNGSCRSATSLSDACCSASASPGTGRTCPVMRFRASEHAGLRQNWHCSVDALEALHAGRRDRRTVLAKLNRDRPRTVCTTMKCLFSAAAAHPIRHTQTGGPYPLHARFERRPARHRGSWETRTQSSYMVRPRQTKSTRSPSAFGRGTLGKAHVFAEQLRTSMRNGTAIRLPDYKPGPVLPNLRLRVCAQVRRVRTSQPVTVKFADRAHAGIHRRQFGIADEFDISGRDVGDKRIVASPTGSHLYGSLRQSRQLVRLTSFRNSTFTASTCAVDRLLEAARSSSLTIMERSRDPAAPSYLPGRRRYRTESGRRCHFTANAEDLVQLEPRHSCRPSRTGRGVLVFVKKARPEDVSSTTSSSEVPNALVPASGDMRSSAQAMMVDLTPRSRRARTYYVIKDLHAHDDGSSCCNVPGAAFRAIVSTACRRSAWKAGLAPHSVTETQKRSRQLRLDHLDRLPKVEQISAR